ncbi:MAG: flagellar basal body P-ring protein FlgI [Planctomycetota bacterium]
MRYALTGILVFLAGCSAFDNLSFRSQSPEEEDSQAKSPRVTGDLVVPYGMHPVRIEGISIVTGLNGTGSDPAPSPQRSVLIDEMQTRGVEQPNALLASKSVAMVMVQGYLRPGIQKGDRFDIEVRVPGRSETTSLRGGWLMQTRLKELAVLGNVVHEGHLLGLAEGPVMIDPSADSRKDQVMATRGRVLGGGVATKSRDLGLVLKPDHQNVFNSDRVATVVNKRFHTFDRGIQIGVAKAQTDKFIKLIVHPRYKDNISRYFRVLRAVALKETAQEQMDRIRRLERELCDPHTAAAAALELEAIGKPGIEALKTGLKSSNTEVRFFAAEALAYLDERDAVEPLGEIARNEPAFRVFALTALSAMDDYGAEDQLRGMLDSTSAETRYGAFRALWAMRPNDPLTRGERLSDQFTFHVVDSAGPPMVHVTHNRRAEIVLFGRGQRLATPLVLSAGNRVMLRSTEHDQISISRFAPNELGQKRLVSNDLEEVIRTIAELGGTYPDIVQALQEAKTLGVLAGRFEVDALPEAGRSYLRVAAAENGDVEASDGAAGFEEAPILPAPELFSKRASPRQGGDAEGEAGESLEDEEEESPGPFRRFFARMTGSAR